MARPVSASRSGWLDGRGHSDDSTRREGALHVYAQAGGLPLYHTHTFAGHDFKMSTSVRRKLPVTRPLTVAGYETVPPPSGLQRGTRALTNQTAFLRQPLCKEHLQRCIIFLENQPATLPGWVQLGSGVSKYNELWRTLQHSRPAARVTRTLVACNG